MNFNSKATDPKWVKILVLSHIYLDNTVQKYQVIPIIICWNIEHLKSEILQEHMLPLQCLEANWILVHSPMTTFFCYSNVSIVAHAYYNGGGTSH